MLNIVNSHNDISTLSILQSHREKIDIDSGDLKRKITWMRQPWQLLLRLGSVWIIGIEKQFQQKIAISDIYFYD